jgi:hypothetical protein
MKHKFLDTKIPTLLGIFLIVIGLTLTTLLTGKETVFQTRAQVKNQPTDVRITNITNNSFTVSYKTSDPTNGSVNFGTSNSLGQAAYDQRDLPEKIQNLAIHSITVSGLSPATKNYFSIISGGETYLNNNQNFEVVTAPTISSSASNNTAIGKVILPDSTPPKEAIVYVTADNSQVLSSLVESNGSYKISLSNLLTSDLSQYYNLSENSIIKMLVLDKSLTSNIILYYSQINNIPLITLSKNYDFRYQEQENASSSVNFESFPSLQSTNSSKLYSPKITTPQKDQGFSSEKPLFKGTGVPNQKIQIIIHSNEQIQVNVSTDSNGNWSYTPTTPLSPGNHNITIIARDVSGILKTITQSFVVYAQDIPTPTITQTPTLILTLTPTPTPYDFLTSSVSATPSQKPLPPTGNESILAVGIIGIVIFLSGSLLFLLAKGK